MGKGVWQGPKYGSKRQAKIGGPEGPTNFEVLSLQLFGTLEPCSRAPHWGIRLDLPGRNRPTSGTIFRRFWGLPGSWMGLCPSIQSDRPSWASFWLHEAS